MSSKYQPQSFEKKWIEKWEKEKTYKTREPVNSLTRQQKKYVLDMFPYPSGAGLHVGHPRGYVASDIISRYYRMTGHAVLHPMGWDAFGLPAENAAIKAKKNPMDIVPDNIATFKRQMKMLGLSYDWEREFNTTDPSYYKWTQWLFIQFYKMGLLYKKNAPINFCPACKTGCSEEEVLPNGTHERCGTKIEKRELPQWLFKITKYADRLLEDLKGLDWPKGILEMQKNWIGRKEGINITYDVVDVGVGFPDPKKGAKTAPLQKIDKITVFTTRPDTNFGATFIVLAPEHEFVKKVQNKNPAITKYVEQSLRKTEIERETEGRKKTGIFTGYYAVNNLNGRLMPIWVSDFVLMGFGTGAVVGVPGHDIRDFEFATEFGLEVIRVVVGKDGDTSLITSKEQVQEEEGTMINSEFLNGLDIHEATQKIMDYIEKKRWGKRVVTYHLRDWIFSRQRYWGEPIPMIFCPKCAENQINQKSEVRGQKPENSDISDLSDVSGIRLPTSDSPDSFGMAGWQPVPEDLLPVELPYVKSYEPTGTGESPLTNIKEWVNTTCPVCGGPAKRETDTMPNWAGSSWYFLAFPFWKSHAEQRGKEETHNNAEDKPSIKNFKLKISNSGSWLPVDWYLGGAEHAVLHLLYSRFWVKALYDLKLLDFTEPFLRLRNQGMILAEDHRKMSKSFGNVVNPDEVVAEFGADSLRLYEMFMAPFNTEISWSTKALHGVYRFLKRVWSLYQIYQKSEVRSQKPENSDISDLSDVSGIRLPTSDYSGLSDETKEDKELVGKLNKTIQKVSSDITDVKFNTAIASMMEFLNDWEQYTNQKSTEAVDNGLSEQSAKQFLKLLAPFAPFTTEEIWHEVFDEKESIHLSNWPEIRKIETIVDEILIPVQVDGKLRSAIKVHSSSFMVQSKVEEIALKDEKVKKYLAGKKYKTVYVVGKILNFVII